MKKLSVPILGLVIGVIGVFYFGFVNPAPSVTVNETKTIQVRDINKISLESSSSSVHFYPSTSNVLTVHLYGKSSRKDLVLSVSKSGDTAMINIGHKKDYMFHTSFLDFMNKGLQVDVEVPQKMYSEITGHSSLGHIEVQQISAGRFNFDSSAGSIKAEDLKGDVTAHSSAGSINLTNIEGKLDLNSSPGSVKVRLKAITQDITAHSSAGTIQVVTEQQPESLQLNALTSAGGIKINLANVLYSTKERDLVTGSIGLGGPKLQLDSSPGSVSINKQ